jgi:hypothetical protein
VAEAKKVEAAKKRADGAARIRKSRSKEQNNNAKMSPTEAHAPTGVPPASPASPASYQWTKEELAEEEELSLLDPAVIVRFSQC